MLKKKDNEITYIYKALNINITKSDISFVNLIAI